MPVPVLEFVGSLLGLLSLIEIGVRRFSGEQGFWIGKASLRQWRQLALEQLEEEEETKHSDCKTNGENSTCVKGNADALTSDAMFARRLINPTWKPRKLVRANQLGRKTISE